MSRVVRWDPFRDLVSMRNQMDQVMNDWLRTSNELGGESGFSTAHLALDVSETENEFRVRASVPGINPDELDISFGENTLTIKGETQQESVEENERYHLRERRFGSFSRTISLPVAVDAENIDAHYENGVLTLTLPKAEETRPRKINVRSNGSSVLEG